MPQFAGHSTNISLFYDSQMSALAGTSVSNLVTVSHSVNFSILFPSSTAGYKLFATNCRYFERAPEPYMANFDNNFAYAMDTMTLDSNFWNTWIDVTNLQGVQLAANAIISNIPFRYVQLRGNSLTSATGDVAYVWTSNSEPGQ